MPRLGHKRCSFQGAGWVFPGGRKSLQRLESRKRVRNRFRRITMKRIVLMALLALALPLAAFATSQVDFSNSGGTLSGSSAGMSLSGSTLVAVNGLSGGLIAGNLGTL